MSTKALTKSPVTTNELDISENKENDVNNMQDSRECHKTPSKKDAKTPSKQSDTYGSRAAGRSAEVTPEKFQTRRSSRKTTPSRKYENFLSNSAKKSSRRRKKSPQENVTSTSASGEESSPENVEGKKSAQLLFENEIDVEGKQMFCFITPKKRGGMALAAMNTPRTPKTPKTPKDRVSSRFDLATPDSKRKKSIESEPKTPRHVRNKIREELAKLVQDSSNSDFSQDESEFNPDSSEEETSDDDEESDEQEGSEEPEEPQARRPRRAVALPALTQPTLRRRGAHKRTEEYVLQSDGYFTSHASSKAKTSDHTLDRLKNPRLPADHLFRLLASMKLSSEHEGAIAGLIDEYKTYFTKWLYLLNEGYNMLLYGLGSKRNLLQMFHKDCLSNQHVVIINGFFPSLTIKDILDSIANDLLDLNFVSPNLHEIVDRIDEELIVQNHVHIFLIVHNIDGTMLRNAKAQEILSRLAKVPSVHLLASIDHINTPLLWDHGKLSNYNFSWWDVTTMLPYKDETAFENSLLVQNSGELALSSMKNVVQSLTANARGIYMLIVKYQLKNKGNQTYQGMPFKDLYSACRESFLVSSDLALRAQLTEFLDHKLVKSKRTIDGTEHLQIPIESGLLQQFIEQQE